MASRKNQFTEEETKLITQLRQRPELRKRFGEILKISNGREGEIKQADEVEALLIEEIRKLGQASMKQWAQEAEIRSGEEYLEKNPGSYCGKKNA
jgi:5'-deoxynucleotidase YfbR-like HD superfamily hydrolase